MKIFTLYLLHNKVAQHDMQDDQEITIGRSEDCNISIDDNLISRKHLRIFFENDQWHIECLSRFGQLKDSNGHLFSKKTVDKDSDFEFWIANYKAYISEASSIQQSDNKEVLNSTNNTSLMVIPEKKQEDNIADDNLENFNADMTPPEDSELVPLEDVINNNSLSNIKPPDVRLDIPDKKPNTSSQEKDQDRTQLVQQGLHSANLEARLKILKKAGREECFMLEGTKWIIGRSKNCEITLNHPKVSRNHCEITYIQDEYYIKDLKSANGTSLNGKKISRLQPTLLHSNDRIHIEDLILYFEIYNTDIEEKLINLSSEKQSSQSSKAGEPKTYQSMSNDLSLTPMDQLSSGVIRIPSNVKKFNKKKFMRITISLLIIIISYILVFDNEEQIGSESRSSKIEGEAMEEFEKLTPEQKSTVVNSYKVAQEMEVQKKFSVALKEIEKIHTLISSYKDSKNIQKKLQETIDTIMHFNELKQMRQDQKRLKQEVAEIVERCRKESQSYTDMTLLQNCLQPAVEKDPENSIAQSLIREMAGKIAEEEMKNKNRSRYLASIRSGKKLYEKAKALQDQDKPLKAIDAYKKHINSSYPDPNKLKDKSKASIDTIRKTVTDKITFYQNKADEKIKAKDHKGAVLLLRKTLELDPSLISSKKKIVEYSTTLTKQMKVLYSESILDESLGHLEEAKEKWQKISKLDLIDGEYYKKAKIKLTKYEL